MASPHTQTNSESISQQLTSPDAHQNISKEAEALLIGSALNMDYRKLRNVALEHLLIHAEEAALMGCDISKEALEKWMVHERRVMLDHILHRRFDEALAALATISPELASGHDPSGCIVALLCAKAREIAVKDEDVALKFISDDVAEAVIGSWSWKQDKKKVASYASEVSAQKPQPGEPLPDDVPDCSAGAKLVEKTIGDILFKRASGSAADGPSLTALELETLANTVNMAVLESIGLNSTSILTAVLELHRKKSSSSIQIDWGVPDSSHSEDAHSEHMQEHLRSQNRAADRNNGGTEDPDDEGLSSQEQFPSWVLSTLLGVRLIN